MKRNFVFSFLLLVAMTPFALADIIVLKTGAEKKGVVVEETENTVTLMTSLGTIGFDKSLIASLQRDSKEENLKLLEQWESQKELKRKKEEERLQQLREIAEEKRAKGLVRYEGKWMTPAEAETERKKKAASGAELEEEAAPPEEGVAPPEGEVAPTGEEKVEGAAGPPPKPAGPARSDIVVSDLNMVEATNKSAGFPRLQGQVINNGTAGATLIRIFVTIYDNQGQVVWVKDVTVNNLKPGETRPITINLNLSKEKIGTYEVNLGQVFWKK